jgi:hypothetical protein
MGKVVKLKQAGSYSEAAAAKLESSGLTVEQAQQLGLYDVTNAATLDKYFEGQPALVLPYYDIHGNPASAHPKWPDFFRIRYLGEDHSFKSAAGDKPKRYTQPKDTGVCAYFPPLVNWVDVAKDSTETIFITEGEFKAAKATAEGFPTIGLGGVYSFRSAGQGIFFLPELEQFNWVRRPVVICYDSDYQDNAGICAAINKLAEELQERGALVYVALLPDVYDDGRKTGLDDLLVERGNEAMNAVHESAEPLALTRRLWQMNEEVVYVNDPGFVVARDTGQKLPISNFIGHSYWATASVPERKVRTDGSISMEKVSAATVWIKWPLRNNVTKLTYMPGEDTFYESKGLTYYNQWKGWGCEPRKGDIKPFMELVKFIFEGAKREDVEWFLDWCAYPIQFPGTKLFSARTRSRQAYRDWKDLARLYARKDIR